ncbi:nuclear transport factor 2 family protein [Micromonospora sp. NPDC049679]|uniref:nuclear transport factor 2 family protein n=1 Tax=Micromonospora sp. NPDC049679 TaxID=3155920 RepID=UPI00340F6463
MSDVQQLAERCLAVWNEADGQRCRPAVAELWTEDGSYSDPMSDVRGHDGIAAVIDGAREMFPGYVFRLLGTVDGHHDVLRFGWELVPADDGESVVVGFDVAVRAGDGRLTVVHGFLDKGARCRLTPWSA